MILLDSMWVVFAEVYICCRITTPCDVALVVFHYVW